MKPGFDFGRSITTRVVEAISALALLIAGAIVQSIGSSTKEPNTLLLVLGGLMVALGGVAASWIASSILAEKQAAEAASHAREELDQKLDNLSRVFGQAAGQISQAVEQAELQQIPPATGFALVSQATRMIYGQVNEIGVIRGVKFDAAQLLETAAKLDDLARQLSGSSAKTSELNEVRRKIQVVQESLSSITPQRQFGEVKVDCPNCGHSNEVKLGSLPGDTAAAACLECGTMFNVHRAQTGSAFTRAQFVNHVGPNTVVNNALVRRPRWPFVCPACGKRGSSAIDDKGPRSMVCTSCLVSLEVDPSVPSVMQTGAYSKTEMHSFGRKGKRPKFLCPTCSKTVVAMLVGDRGYIGVCDVDKLVFEIPFAIFDAFYESDTREAE